VDNNALHNVIDVKCVRVIEVIKLSKLYFTNKLRSSGKIKLIMLKDRI